MSPDVAVQVKHLGSVLERRLDELAQQVAALVRANVDFYRDTPVVSDQELLASCTDNLRYLFEGLRTAEPFDTSPAGATGAQRAAAGAPLAAVMAAFRVASHHLWDALVEAAGGQANIIRDALLSATALVWQAQDVYTDAMTRAHQAQATQKALDDATERSALTEALLQARVSDDRSLWEIAQLLRLPQKGPYLVVAAACPTVGKQALIPSDTECTALLDLLERLSTGRVGVSPRFDNLADTAEALRYARVAVSARGRGDEMVTVFEDSALAVAAVSSPEVTRKLADTILGRFNDLPADERKVLFDTFSTWLDSDGSIARAAEQLYCHPNTVRYRLHRIEERSGRTLSVPRDLAELCLAFEAYRHNW
jgi:DNA-binding PucR family transcriptional regulator